MSEKVTKLPVSNEQATAATAIRVPPCNLDAEQALLGLILVNNSHYSKISEIVQAEHFSEGLHQRIFDSISRLIERGQVATPMILKNQFDQDEALVGEGGSKYLFQLAKQAVQIHDSREVANVIRDLAIKRHLIDIGEEIVNNSYNPDVDNLAPKLIEEAETKLFSLAEKGDTGKGYTSLLTPLEAALRHTEAAMKRGKHIVGVSTGFTDLDNLTGGLQNSDLIILAGRPSMGKTALGVNVLLNAAEYIKRESDEEKGAIGLFSLEMSSEQIAMRLLSMGTGINSTRLRRGDLNEEEFGKLANRYKHLQEIDILVDDTPALSISALRTRARRMKRRHNVRLIMVDYLQLLQGTSKKAADSRVQEISEITQGLKAIAKELNIPVIALSQLSRAVEQREDKRPQLSDLRESGSIEQDADIVMFIYREEYYLMRKEPRPEEEDKYTKWQQDMENARNLTDVIISKQRNGPIGHVTLRFDGNTTMFQNFGVGPGFEE